MKFITFQESLDMSEFSIEISPVEKAKIISDYDLQNRFDSGKLTMVQINAMLQQALWVGFCRGKGYD